LHNANPNLISIKFQKFDYEFTGGTGMYMLNLPTLIQNYIKGANTLKQ
jgi:hypothetical protein